MALSRVNDMKSMTRFVCLLLCVVLLVGCGPQGQTQDPSTAPESSGAAVDTQPSGLTVQQTEDNLAAIRALGESPDDNYRTWYEIFVYSFCDSNGDGIGDLQGVISKLDYLKELGITGIWLMPVNPSQSYHKYDVADYYEIDPAYGTLADMDQLLAECEQRGIKVILDLVLNHTADNHDWFLTAAEYLRNLPADAEPNAEECPYVDYYTFQREAAVNFHGVPNSNWYYEGKFSPNMPDLNLANPSVREDIEAIMRYWLEKGVHGFRLDAVKEFYSGNTPANVEVLSWIQQTASSIKEDVYLVGEAWEGFGALTSYYESGMTSFFDFPFATGSGKIVEVLRGAGNPEKVAGFATALEKAHNAYSGKNPNYIDAPFLSNHDVGRIAGFVTRDELKTKAAGAMNILMSGSCFIYYGEEIGMIGASDNDPSKRAPMYWNAARDNGTTNPPPECVLPEEYPFGSLEEQVEDGGSVYNYYRQVIAIRNAIPAIARGVSTAETGLNSNCVSAFRKTWNEECCIVLININTEAASVDLSEYADWSMAATVSADGNSITLENNTLNLPAFGLAVLVPNN